MKHLLILILLSGAMNSFGQPEFPEFLNGTWKVDGSEIYEHWDQLNEYSFKGLSYRKVNDEMKVTEYLEITGKGHEIIYKATVLNQNNGSSIPFRMTRSDSIWVFENPTHDFPRLIEYRMQDDSTLQVRISDGKVREFSYTLNKQIIPAQEVDSTTSNPQYDVALASRLGADDYGMKGYVLVLLTTGPSRTDDQELIG